MKDYYKILGIGNHVDVTEIKKAYRDLALKFHPDKNKQSDAHEKFIEINEAYEILRDEIKRKQYDHLWAELNSVNKNNSDKLNEDILKNKEWANDARQKAEEYSNMKFDDFADKIIEELKVGISYAPNFVFIAICLGGVVFSFSILQNEPLLGIIMLLTFGIGGYFLYDRAKKDYIKERKQKIINKNK